MENSQVYLKAMMSLVARQTFTPEHLAEIVSPLANARAYEAFNLLIFATELGRKVR